MTPEAEVDQESDYLETNLADMVGRSDDYESTRVATFMPQGDELVVAEACDGYFAVVLDKTEVQRLIDWLNDWVTDQEGK